MLRWSVLGGALLVNLPLVWDALVAQTTSVDTAVIRVLITVPIVAVLLAGVRWASRGSSSADK